VTYDQNGISTKTFLTYSKNKIVGREYYNGKLASIAIHLFDVNGNEVETDLNYIQDSSGRQNGKTLYKYDKKGHKVGEDLYIDKKLVENTTNVYDKDNQLIEENETMYLPHEVKKQRTTNAYDQLGNNIKSEVYAPNGELIEEDVYTYSNYDQNGNWRSAIYIFKSFRYDKAGTSSKSIVKREITYFK